MKIANKRLLSILLAMMSFVMAFSFAACQEEEIIEPDGPNNNWPTALGLVNQSDFSHDDLVWQEEFNGNSLNEANWKISTGNNNGWGNQEKQYYRAENLRVDGGKLQIIARYEVYEGCPYTSAKIETKHQWQYGRFEARIKLPSGQGFWPAFWMMPRNSAYGGWPRSGEIDIMEARGRDPFMSLSTIHYGMPKKDSGGTKYYNSVTQTDSINNWHVYALDWREGNIKFFVDDSLIFEESGTNASGGSRWYAGEGDSIVKNGMAPFDKPFFMILNLAVGGSFDGGKLPSPEMFGALMEIDYVRVYS